MDDEWPRLVQEKFDTLKFTLNKSNEWTVLAGIIEYFGEHQKVVALGAGVKCLPTIVFKGNPMLRQQLLRDCHAEVLARRAFRNYLLKQITLHYKKAPESIFKNDGNGFLELKEGILFGMYISHAPCGDATMHTIPLRPNETVNSVEPSGKRPRSILRGREEALVVGGLRTKPGRGDAPPAPYLSCTDKIALWSVIGWQGALLSILIRNPLLIDHFVIGEHYDETSLTRGILDKVKTGRRVLSQHDSHSPLKIVSTEMIFRLSKSAVSGRVGAEAKPTNLCHIWYEGGPKNGEIIADGRKLGAKLPKDGNIRPKCQISVSSESFRRMFEEAAYLMDVNKEKKDAADYQNSKRKLFTDAASPFNGWPSLN